jgi:hypothetical protein
MRDRVNFINNTLYDNGAEGEIVVYDDYTNFDTCVIRNNIIYSITNGGYGILYDGYASGGITIDHNLFYNSGGSFHASNVTGTSSVSGNPLFTDAGSGDFTIDSDSPAYNAGSSTAAPATDYIGTARPQFTSFDIGAYESLDGETYYMLIGAGTGIGV